MYFYAGNYCGIWNLVVTGRADSETAIRHMAEIFARSESELPRAMTVENHRTTTENGEPRRAKSEKWKTFHPVPEPSESCRATASPRRPLGSPCGVAD